MKRIMGSMCLLLAALLLVASAQQPPEKPREPQKEQRIIDVRHIDVQRLANLISFFGVRAQPEATVRVIVLSGSRDNVAAAEEAVRRLDVPSPAPANIEVTVYMIAAAGPGGRCAALPAEFEALARQLKTSLGFQSYRLIDTMVIRTRDGGVGETTGMAPMQPGDAPRMILQLKFGQAKIEAAATGRAIRIDRLRSGARMPFASGTDAHGKIQWQFIESAINTDLDVREGQKVLVGKASVDGSNDATVVALSAGVVE